MERKISRDLIDFINSSPSCYHVVANFADMLDAAGFVRLMEQETWNIKPGGKYFTVRNDSSIIAFKVPKADFENFQIIASHSDSPTFKIKENPEIGVEGHYVKLNTEKYGGMIYAPWLDRPLSVAGRIVVKEGNKLVSKLVNVDRDLLVIPNMAIHMNRKINDGYVYNPQKDLLPLFGCGCPEGDFDRIIAEAAGVQADDVISKDLFLYSRVQGAIWGAKEEFISSAKLDDLQCAYTSMRAFLDGGNGSSVTMCCVFDNEEVGSNTMQGADSTMLSDCMERISDSLGKSTQMHKAAVSGSFLISADNAHGVHPSIGEKADPTNRPYINEGIVIKYHANQKYTTDAISVAVFKGICVKAQVPFQSFANRSDEPGGSTLGNISTAHVSVNSVDIGLPQLAMHSPYETAGVMDTSYMLKALTQYYNTFIAKVEDGIELR